MGFRIGIGADMGIFPLIGISSFERGPKPNFFIYLFFCESTIFGRMQTRA